RSGVLRVALQHMREASESNVFFIYAERTVFSKQPRIESGKSLRASDEGATARCSVATRIQTTYRHRGNHLLIVDLGCIDPDLGSSVITNELSCRNAPVERRTHWNLGHKSSELDWLTFAYDIRRIHRYCRTRKVPPTVGTFLHHHGGTATGLLTAPV